jgi:demethylmenaquinone methyltransferase / 2-methoxy-6-polyprenyl-1,4-benzoquinol methylase
MEPESNKTIYSPQTVNVGEMFNNIAPKYDFLNHFLSAGIDRRWRKKTIASLKKYNPKTILDVATGTADLAIQSLTLNPENIIGIDIAEKMLDAGRVKIKKINTENRIQLIAASAEDIPFPDQSFDAVTVAFGVRNFVNLSKGLSEMHRVLKPGGVAAILEFSMPEKFPVKQGYRFYFKFFLPLIGRMVSKSASAYTYLPETIYTFPQGEKFSEIMTNVGFTKVTFRKFTFGIATLYVAEK